jgi:hypothetical protein
MVFGLFVFFTEYPEEPNIGQDDDLEDYTETEEEDLKESEEESPKKEVTATKKRKAVAGKGKGKAKVSCIVLFLFIDAVQIYRHNSESLATLS